MRAIGPVQEPRTNGTSEPGGQKASPKQPKEIGSTNSQVRRRMIGDPGNLGLKLEQLELLIEAPSEIWVCGDP